MRLENFQRHNIKLSLLRSFLSFLPLAKINKQSHAQRNTRTNTDFSFFWILNTLTVAHFGTRVDAFCERFTHSNICMNVVLTHITVKLSIFIVNRIDGWNLGELGNGDQMFYDFLNTTSHASFIVQQSRHVHERRQRTTTQADSRHQTTPLTD